MELFAMKDLSGARALADPAQQGWRGTHQEWLSRRMAVIGLRIQERDEGPGRARRPHRLLRLRGGWGGHSGRSRSVNSRRAGATKDG